jgi:hypothetical protein
MINEVNETKYAVKVNGQIVSPSYATLGGAEDMIKLLSEAHQSIAEIVPVTPEGQEILFG